MKTISARKRANVIFGMAILLGALLIIFDVIFPGAISPLGAFILLIPIGSYFFLVRLRCSNCGAFLAKMYPLGPILFLGLIEPQICKNCKHEIL